MAINQNANGPVDAARVQAGESLLGLSTKTGIPRNTLRRKIANPSSFTLAELSAVASAIGWQPLSLASNILEGVR
jgi:hypothetical protein